jgi:metal-responsive CopG/Arc/MetJ family transcriptional regulator
MSNKNHDDESIFQVHIDTELLKQFDIAIKKLNYKNRADWTREKMRQEIERAKVT